MKQVTYLSLCATLFFSIIIAEDTPIKKTTLFEEIRRNDKPAIRKRLEKDEDISEREEETENNALHIAAENDDPEMIELLTTQPERSFFYRWTYYLIYNQAKLPNKDGENKEGDTPGHCAVHHGNGKITQKLVEQGINLNKKNKKGETLLLSAAKAKKTEIIQQLCKTTIDANEKDNQGKGAIHYTIENKDIESTKSLAMHGADLSIKDSYGKRPLHYSIIQNILPITEYLIEKGADINAQDTMGNTPMHSAITKDNLEAAEYLIKKGANPNIRNNAKFSPIFWILEKNKPQFIPLLVKYQLHTQQTGNGDSLLHIAILNNNNNFVNELASLKDLSSIENGQSNTPMMFAAELNNLTALKILHQKGVSLTTSSSNGFQPIHRAAKIGSYEAAQYLLENGVAVDSTTASNTTPLQLAIMQGNLNMVDLCLYFKADISKQNLEGNDAFLIAIKHNNPDIINRLKKHPRFNMNARDKNGRTGLMNAVINDNQSIVQGLVESGADISIADNQKENVLHKIARVGNISMLDLILRSSQSKKLLDQQNEKGNTPFLIAIAHDHRKTTELLLEKVNVHIKNNNDDTALSFAVDNGNAELVQLLTERYNLPVNIITKDGRIPLFVAVEKGDENSTKALLKAGASLLTKNNKNETIIHAAVKQTNPDILRNLLQQKDRPSLEIADNTGYTPLCWAAYTNNFHYIRILEQSGANSLYVTPDGNTIAHCATSGKAVDALDYIIKKYPHLISTPNRQGETPLLCAAQVDSLACAEKLLREEDFITRNIDKAISIAKRNNHTAFARSLDQKIINRKKKREAGAQKEKDIFAVREEINKLDQKISQKSWWHSQDISLNQKISSIKQHSLEELYNKTDAECDQLFASYTQILDAAINRKHQLVNKWNDLLQAEEAERLKKEKERLQEERKRLEEEAREQRMRENQRIEEQNRIQQQQKIDAVNAQKDELERIRKQKEKDDAQKAEQERINTEKAQAEVRIRDAEMVRKQKDVAAAVAAQKKTEADDAKHTHALEQQQSFFPMNLKPSAPPIEDENIAKPRTEREKKNAARRKQAETVRNFKKAAANASQENVQQQDCQVCQHKMHPKPVKCSECKQEFSDICVMCWDKQKGQCCKCWKEIGQFLHKEKARCYLCLDDTSNALPCKNCKVGSARVCAECLKEELTKTSLENFQCPFCRRENILEQKLVDEILKQK